MNATPQVAQQVTPQDAFDEAIIRQWTWKTGAMERMAVAICKLAIERGTKEFSANDLPEFEHGGSGIAGAIFSILAERLLVLSPVGTFHGTVFQQRTVRNAGGNHINVWRLASPGLARALLKVHGRPVPELKQVEFPVSS